ncbi:hypothetical protein PC118_g17384 [Phytophthora cactorum]|uniref:Uncharacterized protein n=1 Tax=Phytophthora cactorum TaxID=29920 RepID=A0A8T1FG30_9STRA|nr:hypothetical protein PC114_g19376 [Phytophthora cactorum]KAG2912455.1 hypothetical protein PC117_g18894 [Phytophthora cactorum]KAG2969556.1 hypothetical protein PC118_g17384 [Phytophthora cactorum]KAG3006820.1 hypothetical protein PC120_g17130 [Phytophthora cactorum]
MLFVKSSHKELKAEATINGRSKSSQLCAAIGYNWAARNAGLFVLNMELHGSSFIPTLASFSIGTIKSDIPS